MGFFDFLSSLGVQEQYTREEFALQYSDDPIHATGAWGVDDMPFMDAMAKDLRGLSTPFCAILFCSVIIIHTLCPRIIRSSYVRVLCLYTKRHNTAMMHWHTLLKCGRE